MCCVTVFCNIHVLTRNIQWLFLPIVVSSNMTRMEASSSETTMQVVNEVVEIRTVTIRISKQGRERRDRLLKSKLCLVCEEAVAKGAVRRGCCAACRQYITRMVAKGEASVESFIRDGKLLESQERGGVRPHPKRAALRRKSEVSR